MKHTVRSIAAGAIALALVGTLTGCEMAEFAVDDVKARWQGREATLYTYDNNSGQTTAVVTGKSIYPFRNEAFDVIDSEGKTEKGAWVSVSVGKNVVDLVGSSAMICDDEVHLIPRDQIDIAASSTDSGTPWLNVLQRNVSNMFTGQNRIAVIKTQNDVPVAAFTADSVTMVSGNEEIKNTTWFKMQDGDVSSYCWVYRVNAGVYDIEIVD
jgi:Domain of unknown function (DUF5052)